MADHGFVVRINPATRGEFTILLDFQNNFGIGLRTKILLHNVNWKPSAPGETF